MFGKTDEPVCCYDKKPCIKERCANKWVHIRGKHPQTGTEVDMFDCADKWVPMFLLEIARKEHETGGAVESFRNEMKAAQPREDRTALIGAIVQAVANRQAHLPGQKHTLIEG